MVQGDKYSIGIAITQGSTTIVRANVTEVIVKLGEIVGKLSDSTLSFDSTTSKWKLPVSQSQTLNLRNVMFQVQVVFTDGTIVNSVPKMVHCSDGIIREVYAV